MQLIPPTTTTGQYRALGLVCGTLTPSSSYASATLTTPDGRVYPATPGRFELLAKFQACVESGQTYWFYVHPQPRGTRMGLGIIKIMSTADAEPEEGFLVAPEDAEATFNIRGTISPQGDSIDVIVERKPHDGKHFPPLVIPLQGFLPGAAEGEFWDLWAELEGDDLILVDGSRVE
ncbi:MAG: hypothetical protein AAFY57_12160 [Cyanobacteria bacterium J06642_2]